MIIEYLVIDEIVILFFLHSIYTGASNSRVIGITIAHPPAQSLNMRLTTYDPEIATDAKWVKIISWRANGDGFGLKGNAYMEDCSIRAGDDSTYVGGRGMKRVVIWNDSNGSAFVLSHIGSDRIAGIITTAIGNNCGPCNYALTKALGITRTHN